MPHTTLERKAAFSAGASRGRIVVPGGTGHVGRVLCRALAESGYDVVVLGRGRAPPPAGTRLVPWDGRRVGAWASEIDGADAVLNLAGRSVDCRYHKTNLTEMLASRIDSTRAVGRAIEQATRPPRVWLQASTATIYAHRFDAPNDEATGVLGGDEPDAPTYWRYSIEIAKAWERELSEARTPRTRRVALRMAMVMAPHPPGTFAILRRLCRYGLGGTLAGGAQFMSWIHDRDLVRAIEWLLAHDEVEGAVNLAAPEPLPQREFMRELRAALGVPFGIPGTKSLLEVAAFFHRTDTELLLKSRRVVPGRLLAAGFRFEFPSWPAAARDLAERARSRTEPSPAAAPSPPSPRP